MTIAQANESALYYLNKSTDQPGGSLNDSPGVGNLQPYYVLGVSNSDGLVGLGRHKLNVDSLAIVNSPNSGTLVDLDTIQLYTNYAGGSANIGTTYVNADSLIQ